jgi:hypothetical protein
MTRFRFQARRKPGAVIYRFAATPGGVNRVGNSDSLGVLMLSVVLFGMNFLMLLEILGTLKSFFTDLKYDKWRLLG